MMNHLPLVFGRGRKVSYLKSWSMFFDDIKRGIRTSDIRCTDDRSFSIGDILVLKRYDPVKAEFTGDEMTVEVTYVQNSRSNPCAISADALRHNYVVLSIREVYLVDY